jgi:pyruvate dehydrogenase E2 component (dihydrolipoamide acetyltransferase)
MPFEVVLPRLGWNMETGRLGQWLKKDGERVEAGELLFTVEGDKATQEVEALDSGILRIPPDAPPPGKEVPVGTLLGYLLAPGEEIAEKRIGESANRRISESANQRIGESANQRIGESANQRIGESANQRIGESANQRIGESATREASEHATHNTQHATRNTQHAPPISPRARRVAGELGVDWSGLKGSGRTGRIVERDVRQAAEHAPRTSAQPPFGTQYAIAITPLARKLAEELGVDVDALAARLPGKRIERADIEAAAREAVKIPAPVAPPTAPAVPAVPPSAPEALRVLPITSVRRIIADRMATSAHTAAALTLTTEADATELVKLRRQLKDAHVTGASEAPVTLPSYNDLLAKLVAQALMEHPMLNARFEGDAIIQAATANIGIAVDTERGLLVPVLRDVQTKSLRQIARESAGLIERVRTGRITADELHGGAFTITNLGMFEIDAFTPIINLPECAILGVGRIIPKQVVVGAIPSRSPDADIETLRVAIRQMMFLSLTFDHRLVDGAPAARFLQRVKQFVEKPYLWLVG